jgi:hypothetical protein
MGRTRGVALQESTSRLDRYDMPPMTACALDLLQREMAVMWPPQIGYYSLSDRFHRLRPAGCWMFQEAGRRRRHSRRQAFREV